MLVLVQNNTFVPAWDSDFEEMKKFKENEMLEVKVSRKRNVNHHRKYFAMLTEVVNNAPDGIGFETRKGDVFFAHTTEQLLKLLKFLMNMYEYKVQPDGDKQIEYDSINFSSMSQDEFEEFYDTSIRIVCNQILVGTDVEDFKNHIREQYA